MIGIILSDCASGHRAPRHAQPNAIGPRRWPACASGPERQHAAALRDRWHGCSKPVQRPTPAQRGCVCACQPVFTGKVFWAPRAASKCKQNCVSRVCTWVSGKPASSQTAPAGISTAPAVVQRRQVPSGLHSGGVGAVATGRHGGPDTLGMMHGMHGGSQQLGCLQASSPQHQSMTDSAQAAQ